MSAVFSGYLLSAGLNDNTRIDFQISFNPDWQIDDGFLKGQSWNEITLMTLNIYSSLERERVFS